jgi:hypothetical protein
MMRFTFKSFCVVAVFSPMIGLAQGTQTFPLESRRCDALPDHAAVQECQQRGKVAAREWEKQMKERYAPGSFRLNRAETKPPINCFKRESTGEQVCAN